MTFACKKCKKVFRKDTVRFEESDEYCPNCDNHWLIEAKLPEIEFGVEAEDVRVDNRFLKDPRMRGKGVGVASVQLSANKPTHLNNVQIADTGDLDELDWAMSDTEAAA